ncbi:kelch repeat-containing protein [Paraburkholderia sp. 40]|uniref:kelch repeat-containing protein n=1 Tax=Paraburkholderia sp. 40 TaxID=2991059 RepID=UPI003D1D184C
MSSGRKNDHGKAKLAKTRLPRRETRLTLMQASVRWYGSLPGDLPGQDRVRGPVRHPFGNWLTNTAARPILDPDGSGIIVVKIKHCLTDLIMLLASLVAGCGGGSSGITQAPPSGLTERETSVVCVQGNEIIPNLPSSSGGAITNYSVFPPLPAGLTLDRVSGAITGTPSGTSNAAVYTITGSNAGGSTTARVQIEVEDVAMAPDTLEYLDSSTNYVTNAPITPDTPIATGGEITQYTVSPPLPPGLTLDPQTGVITGTPMTPAPPMVYTVTGSNGVDTVETQITIGVDAQAQPPMGLAYKDPAPDYAITLAIVPNVPVYSGGEITQFSVSPALPAGLSLNAQNGEISGTPTAALAQTTFIVTGSNAAGNVATQVAITVTAESAGEWLPANAMKTRRYRHTATLLSDGRVLVAAGSNGKSLSLAELYDPASDKWSPTGNLTDARQSHTATLLPGGKVLVAGGSISNGKGTSLPTAELYDPIAGKWTETGEMSQARDLHTATLLPDGRVLVAGGEAPGGAQSSVELYDPVNGAWLQTGFLNEARDAHTATLLPNGRVLVAGGDGKAGALASAELYDPATGKWSETGSMTQAREQHTATLLTDGRVLVAGGEGNAGAMSSAELYDPATGTWSHTGGMSQAREDHAAVLLANGKVLATAGIAQLDLFSDELYDPATGNWSQTDSLGLSRDSHTATRLSDGRVLVAGGQLKNKALSMAELFH